jgi:hypothetical protein
MVRELLTEGHGIPTIARHLGGGRHTLQRYARAATWQELADGTWKTARSSTPAPASLPSRWRPAWARRWLVRALSPLAWVTFLRVKGSPVQADVRGSARPRCRARHPGGILRPPSPGRASRRRTPAAS